MSVDSGRIAELEMRVGSLEADVAELQRKLIGMTGALEILIKQVEDLRRRLPVGY